MAVDAGLCTRTTSRSAVPPLTPNSGDFLDFDAAFTVTDEDEGYWSAYEIAGLKLYAVGLRSKNRW